LAQIETDLDQSRSENWRSSNLAMSVISRSQRSRLVASIVVDSFIPTIQSADGAENQRRAMFDIAHLAAALAVYRGEHSAYPNNLAELVPSIIPALPVDPYHGKSYIYNRIADGYLLYSCGKNGADNDGSNAMRSIYEGYSLEDLEKLSPPKTPCIPDDADDISVRVPQLKPAASPPVREGEAPAEPPKS
jgi:hypothetical protein